MIYTIEGTTYFTGDSVNNGVVANAVFLGNAVNEGEITGFALFADSSTNVGSVSVARYEDVASNQGITLSATFTDQSQNLGVIEEEALFAGDSQNNGIVSEDANAYFIDNAVNLGSSPPPLVYNRADGAYYDGYRINGLLAAPADYATRAYEIDYMWYTFDENGQASFANGEYVYNPAAGYAGLFSNGILIADNTRLVQEADSWGARNEGMINIYTLGERWYFYGNYYSNGADYIAGRAAILANFCTPEVDEQYSVPGWGVVDIYCLSGTVTDYNGYVAGKFSQVRNQQFNEAVEYVNAVAATNYVGKYTRPWAAYYLIFTEFGNHIRWIYNHVQYSSSEAYLNAVFADLAPNFDDDNDNDDIYTFAYSLNENDVVTQITSQYQPGQYPEVFFLNGNAYSTRAAAEASICPDLGTPLPSINLTITINGEEYSNGTQSVSANGECGQTLGTATYPSLSTQFGNNTHPPRYYANGAGGYFINNKDGEYIRTDDITVSIADNSYVVGTQDIVTNGMGGERNGTATYSPSSTFLVSIDVGMTSPPAVDASTDSYYSNGAGSYRVVKDYYYNEGEVVSTEPINIYISDLTNYYVIGTRTFKSNGSGGQTSTETYLEPGTLLAENPIYDETSNLLYTVRYTAAGGGSYNTSNIYP